MIDLEFERPRSRRTQNPMEMCQENPGLMFVTTIAQKNYILNIGGIHVVTYSEDVLKCGLGFKGNYHRFYFEDFFMQKRVTWEDILKLDNEHKDIFIRGTAVSGASIPGWFNEHMKEKYPESMI